MENTKNINPWVFRWVLFYLFFYGLGLIVSYWFGLGWFLLFQTLQKVLFAFPTTYYAMLKFLTGTEVAEKEKLIKRGRWFTSVSYARNAFIYLLVTILAFWKANIPLQQVIQFFIGH